MSIGTSINGPITVVNATVDLIPKTATETVIAGSNLLLEAVKFKI